MRIIFTVFLLGFSILLSACGGGSDPEPVEPTSKSVYFIPKVSTPEVVRSQQPLFVFARLLEDATSETIQKLPLCNSAKDESPETFSTTLRLLKVTEDLTEETIEKNVEHQEVLQVPNDCLFELTLDDVVLEEGQGYAWEVFDEKEKNGNRKWHSLVYMSASAISFLKEDPLVCEGNLVVDPSFYSPKQAWVHASHLSTQTVTLTQVSSVGHEDNFAAQLKTPQTIVYQTLDRPIERAKHYQLQLSIKAPEQKHQFQLKALAFNGNFPNDLQPSSDAAVIGVTGILPAFDEWYRVTLDVWTANQDFESLAIAIFNEQNRPIEAEIDRVCLQISQSNPCEQDVVNFGDSSGVPDGFDVDASSPTITQVEYLAGSVEDLYPNEDVSTIDWYGNPASNDTVLGCAIDNETDDETQSDDDTLAEFELEDVGSDAVIEELEEFASTLPDDNVLKNTNFTTIQPVNSDKCTDAIRDSSKPFSGRDIVYIHGLQLAALKDNVKLPVDQEFQGKWPSDPQAFYKGGAFYEESAHYWSEHIERGLGGTTTATASNSYVIVTWSANQRVPYAINAVLTQIRDAMAGENSGVVQSASAKEKQQCFGDNGIVVVTHSTGGLVASTMFGMGEVSHINPQINAMFGDFRFITDKIDAQVGINSAYGGSPLAEVALALLTEYAFSPLAQQVVNNVASDYLGFAPNPAIANVNLWYNTMLYDLVQSVSADTWRPYMKSTIPTLTSVGSIAGVSDESDGGFSVTRSLIKGFDDGVLSPSSQANNIVRRPRFDVKNRRFLKDKGVPRKKRLRMVADGKKSSGNGARNYFVSPYLAPSGMLQNQSVDFLIDLPNQHVANHHTVIQNSGDHFDNVNLVDRNGHDYGMAKNSIRNYEESSIVFNSALYSTSLLHQDFGTLTQEWVRKETWGLHLPGLRWINGPFGIQLPQLYWKYYEWVKWKRHYHLLKDHQTKMAMDYMYEHVLR